MPHRLTTYTDPAAFAAAATPFLMAREAVNTLPLGLIAALVAGTSPTAAPPFMATASHDGEITAVCLRTPPYRLIITDGSNPAVLPVLADHVAAISPELPGVNAPAALARDFAAAWTAATGASSHEGRPLGLYALREVAPPPAPAGKLRRATIAESDLVVAWFLAFHAEVNPNEPANPDQIAHSVAARLTQSALGIWLWEVAGEPVTVVGVTGATLHTRRIGPVYTPPAHRRHGYASAATAGVSQVLLDAGVREVVLFTDLGNATTNHIYQAVGYQPIGAALEILFTPASAGG